MRESSGVFFGRERCTRECLKKEIIIYEFDCGGR